MNENFNTKIFDGMLKNNEYKNITNYLTTVIEDMDEKKIIEILKYKEILINKQCSIAKEKELVVPLRKYLQKRIKDKKFLLYIENCKIINTQYREVFKYLYQEVKKLQNYSYNVAVIVVLSKIETINRKIIKDIGKIEAEISDVYSAKNAITKFQINVEGASILLDILMKSENRFRTVNNIASRDMFFANIQKCNKKVFSLKCFEKALFTLQQLKILTEELKEGEFNLYQYKDNNIVLEYDNLDEYNRKNIFGIRCDISDSNYEYMFKQSISSKYSSIKNELGEYNVENTIGIEEKLDHITIKIDFKSNEFINILLDEYKDFTYQLELLFSNTFTKNEMHNIIKGNNIELNITYLEAVDFFFYIKIYTAYYFNATSYYFKQKGKYPIITDFRIEREKLYSMIEIMQRILKKPLMSKEKYNTLIELYSFGSNNMYDLYYKPLYVIGNSIHMLPSIFRHNNFGRTFLTHLNSMQVPYKQGIDFEKYIKNLFEEYDFKIYDRKSPKLNFELESGKKGDIDFLALKGKYIFYSQIKNRSNPIETSEYISFDRKINKKALEQLNYAKEFLLSNPSHITECLEIKRLEDYTLVPFIIINSFYGSGEKRKGVYLIDRSALEVFFRQGKITAEYKGKVIFSKQIRTENIEEDFFKLLSQPYFLDVKLYNDLYIPKIYDTWNMKFTLKVSDDVIRKHGQECYLKDISPFYRNIKRMKEKEIDYKNF